MLSMEDGDQEEDDNEADEKMTNMRNSTHQINDTPKIFVRRRISTATMTNLDDNDLVGSLLTPSSKAQTRYGFLHQWCSLLTHSLLSTAMVTDLDDDGYGDGSRR
ncbi:uncharacterized protein G2W53_016344 [Senna tora]|uniref:Uncharacterized protein n=1 Tax=Senna tora TaxID=362788 RepID=A0A834TNR7_9FABA|nr:uncharacterized protein G2W53_016344 [Senna tora]